MITPLISIITPIYNNEKYLCTFIESILSQTYSNWELILVDDGSADRSGNICDEYCHKDKRIKSIHHASNGGICKARNTGILQSEGEWIMILDADDSLFPDGVASLVECISDDIDLVSAAYRRYVNGVLRKELRASLSEVLSVRDYTEKIGIIPQSRNLDRYVWNKLFKASIIRDNSVLFQEDLTLFEDVCFVYQYLEHCHHCIYCTSIPVYSYFRRTDGTAMSSRNHYNERTFSWLLAYTRIVSIINRMDVPQDVRNRVKDEVFDIYRYIIGLIEKEHIGKDEKKRVSSLLESCFGRHTIIVSNLRYCIGLTIGKGKAIIHKLVHSVR